MSSLFDDLKEGLQEAIDFEKGNSSAKTVTFVIDPVERYSEEGKQASLAFIKMGDK